MTAAEAIETLRQVNINLRSALIRLRPEQTHCSNIKPQEFSDLLSQLHRAAECLRGPMSHPEAAAAFESESLEYLTNLEELKDFLPSVQVRLLAEKSRLETARTHAAAAGAWAQANKDLL